MKYLLVLIVIAIAIGAWRSQRRSEARERQRAAAPRSAAVPPPQDMAECAHCGVHLPRSEAVQSGGRSYCSAEHLALSRQPGR